MLPFCLKDELPYVIFFSKSKPSKPSLGNKLKTKQIFLLNQINHLLNQ